MNWLVAWYVWVTATYASVPAVDVYTGESSSYNSLSCTIGQEKKAMTKWFATKYEADQFIKSAPEKIRKHMALIEATEVKDKQALPLTSNVILTSGGDPVEQKSTMPISSGNTDFYKGMKLMNGMTW